MSRRANRQQQQPAAAAAGSSRRTRRAELPPRPPAGLVAEGPQIVSNPIFRCEAGPSQQQQPNNSPLAGDQLRCVYRPGSLYALVHDPAAGSGVGVGKAPQQPLPLPPCRAHPSGRVGPAAHAVVGVPHGGRVLRRATTHHDPFLAAYVACSKSAAAGDEVVHRPQHKQTQGRRRKKSATTSGKKCKEGEVNFRGCGMIWSGWTTVGAKYAGAISCRYGCAVASGHKGDGHATKTKSEDDAPAGPPTLDLTWTPAVLSARALERREQR